MNIEGDAKLLRNQFGCVLRGWLDLRWIAVNQPCYGKALVLKLKRFEEELNLLHNEEVEEVSDK